MSINYSRQESLRRNGVALIVYKSVWSAALGCNLKNDRIISVHFQGKPFNVTVIWIYVPTSNAEEAEVERFYEDLPPVLVKEKKPFLEALQQPSPQILLEMTRSTWHSFFYSSPFIYLTVPGQRCGWGIKNLRCSI